MPNIPQPMGMVDLGLAFDSLTLVWGLTVVVMLGGLAVLLWAVRARDRVTYRLRCPTRGTMAVIQLRTLRGNGGTDVEKCSLCDPPTRIDCEKHCLGLVA